MNHPAQKANVWPFSTQVGWVFEILILPRHATLRTTNHPRWAFGSNRYFIDNESSLIQTNDETTVKRPRKSNMVGVVCAKIWIIFAIWSFHSKIKQILLTHGRRVVVVTWPLHHWLQVPPKHCAVAASSDAGIWIFTPKLWGIHLTQLPSCQNERLEPHKHLKNEKEHQLPNLHF